MSVLFFFAPKGTALHLKWSHMTWKIHLGQFFLSVLVSLMEFSCCLSSPLPTYYLFFFQHWLLLSQFLFSHHTFSECRHTLPNICQAVKSDVNKTTVFFSFYQSVQFYTEPCNMLIKGFWFELWDEWVCFALVNEPADGVDVWFALCWEMPPDGPGTALSCSCKLAPYLPSGCSGPSVCQPSM